MVKLAGGDIRFPWIRMKC